MTETSDVLTSHGWRCIVDGPCEAAESMALDLAILEGCQQARSPATIRFYTWARPSVSVGRGHADGAGVDREVCRRLGVPVVRRPTGGRTVVHTRELTYSVAAPVEAPPLRLYAAICDALVAGLHLLGVNATRARPRSVSFSEPVARSSCFASVSREEVEVAGRKLIGSAQRRLRGAFLQQGSLPLGDPVPWMCEVLVGGTRPGFAAFLRTRLTWLEAHCESRPTWEGLAATMVDGFRRSWGITIHRGSPSGWERRRAAFLTPAVLMSSEAVEPVTGSRTERPAVAALVE